MLLRAVAMGYITLDPVAITADTIDELYAVHSADHQLQDPIEEVREGSYYTDLPDQTPFVRGLSDYESRSVVAQMADGSWVGWTYWYGGGKFAQPASIEWMAYAYPVAMTEKQVVTTQRTFTVIA